MPVVFYKTEKKEILIRLMERSGSDLVTPISSCYLIYTKCKIVILNQINEFETENPTFRQYEYIIIISLKHTRGLIEY